MKNSNSLKFSIMELLQTSWQLYRTRLFLMISLGTLGLFVTFVLILYYQYIPKVWFESSNVYVGNFLDWLQSLLDFIMYLLVFFAWSTIFLIATKLVTTPEDKPPLFREAFQYSTKLFYRLGSVLLVVFFVNLVLIVLISGIYFIGGWIATIIILTLFGINNISIDSNTSQVLNWLWMTVCALPIVFSIFAPTIAVVEATPLDSYSHSIKVVWRKFWYVLWCLGIGFLLIYLLPICIMNYLSSLQVKVLSIQVDNFKYAIYGYIHLFAIPYTIIYITQLYMKLRLNREGVDNRT